ncbi:MULTISPECIES: alkene reductase [Pseudomonas]|uniref:alkene reductase n=1 Tax=Pseudomonas TaxID=286 RepID=UPI00159704FA|nr:MULTISPECIES: alkene reductase [Pseudomonas]
MTHDPLFQPLQLGALNLPNRVLMPPMTRSRAAQPGDVPTALMAEYYAQRASAGLIVSEGTWIAPLGKGYARTPGIHTQAQIDGWRLVTEAVQAEGVNVFIDNADGTPGFVQASQPRALDEAEIAGIVDQYRQAARNAMATGFDGVELRAANGYLFNQFLDSGANDRTDRYGGSLENRLRFLDEVTRALVDGTGDAQRVGVRLAPLTTLNGCVDDDPVTTYTAAAKRLGEIGIGYLHIAEADWDDAPDMPLDFKQQLRAVFPGVMVYAGKYTGERARRALEEGWADLIGFGRPFVANPDLPARLRLDAPLAEHERATLFGGVARGLTDYPALATA